jgi:DNA-binding YbaB/EbfC family protein
MKLPKNFGGQGFGGMMDQMKSAMARANTLEEELAAERITIEKEFVKAVFNGRGELQTLTIAKELVDPDDVDGLETALVAALREGFEKATELRDERVKEILPNVPNIPGLTS